MDDVKDEVSSTEECESADELASDDLSIPVSVEPVVEDAPEEVVHPAGDALSLPVMPKELLCEGSMLQEERHRLLFISGVT